MGHPSGGLVEDLWAQKDSLPPVRKPIFLPFALLGLDVMTESYSFIRHDDMFHVEHI
jgi:hypothetical protein